jgi:hypothetical protein
MSHSTYRCWKKGDSCNGRIYAFDVVGAESTVRSCPRRIGGECYLARCSWYTSPVVSGAQEPGLDRFLLWLSARPVEAH